MSLNYLQRKVSKMIKDDAKDIHNQPWESQKAWMLQLGTSIEELTPRQFTQVFPITEKYDGEALGEKDYYSVTSWIEENIGWDSKIPDGVVFLMEYLNDDVQLATVQVIHILSKFHQRQTGQDMLTAFFESQGIHVRRIDDWGQSDADNP